MSNPMNSGGPGGGNFKPVSANYDIQTGARTQIEGGLVRPSGRTPLNVAGSAKLDRLATDAGLNIEQYNVEFEADDVNHVVNVSICTELKPGILPIRRENDGRTVTIHLGGVFTQFPHMRPAGKRKCQVWTGKDTKGQPCLVISLGTGLGTRTTPRSDDDATTQA